MAGSMLHGRIERLYIDNRVGMAPTNRRLPPALKFALRYCDSVVFIPQGSHGATAGWNDSTEPC